MNQEKKISVCIPFYNIASYVNRCLDSVLGNTYQDLEVICVNDGSTDKTSMLLHQYAEKDSRVIVIDKENGWLVSARQAAIGAATGDFISFLDGDDWIHHQFFEILMFVQKKTGVDAVICGYQKCTEHVVDIDQSVGETCFEIADYNKLLANDHALSHIGGRIFARKLIPTQALSTDMIMGEDTALNYLFLFANGQANIAILPTPLYCYFQREGSIVRTIPHLNKIKVSGFIKDHFYLFSEQQSKTLALHEILRTMLAYRYLAMFQPDQQKVHNCCDELYRFCAKNWCGTLSLKDRAAYCLLYHLPILYRLFRIMKDPSMLKWERREKRHNQNR